MNRSHLAVAAAIIGLAVGATLYTAGRADAHDFTPTISTYTCVTTGGVVAKQATVTVANQFNMAATFTSTSLSGSTLPLIPNGSNQYTLHASASTVGKGNVDLIRVTWTDGYTLSHSVQPNWGSQPCEGSSTTVPPSTTSTGGGCPAGQQWSTVPPVGCYPAPTTVATEPPVTAPDATTTSIAQPISNTADTTTTAPAAIVHAGPPRTNTPNGSHTVGQLPATGTGMTLAAIGAFLLVLGLVFGIASYIGGRIDRRNLERTIHGDR